MSEELEQLDLDQQTDVALSAMALLLTNKQVGLLLGGISERYIRSMVSSGNFPAPIKLGRLARWRRKDIEEWVRGL